MKILHVIEIRGIGGAEKLLVEMLPVLARENSAASCLFIYRTPFEAVTYQLAKKLTGSGVSVFFVKYDRVYDMPKLIYQTNKKIEAAAPDIIHTHLSLAEFCLATLKTLGLKTPVVTTFHGYPETNNTQFDPASLSIKKKSLRLSMLRFVCRRLDGFIFISDFLLNFFIHNKIVNKNQRNYRVDNGCVFPDIIKPDEVIIDRNHTRIVLPGRLVERKGHVFAFEAVKLLSEKYPTILLDCYGLGPDIDILRQQIGELGMTDHIRLQGFSENIVQTISKYDIALLPSMYEPFGIVFLDSFAAKVPVIAFDLPAGNEIITDGYNGLLAEPKNAASLAAKAEILIEDNRLRDNIVINAHKTLQEKYSMDLMVNAYLSVYRELIAKT